MLPSSATLATAARYGPGRGNGGEVMRCGTKGTATAEGNGTDEVSLSSAPPRAARPDLTAGFRRATPPCFFRTARAPSVPYTANGSAPGASGTEQNPNERHLRAAPAVHACTPARRRLHPLRRCNSRWRRRWATQPSSLRESGQRVGASSNSQSQENRN